MSRQNGMPTPMGAEGRTYYPHERPQGLMPKGDFPDKDELETGEPPSHFRDREPAGEFDESQILHEIEAGITPELREQAADFAGDIMENDLTENEQGKLLAYVLSVLAKSPEQDAGKRLELARQAVSEMMAKIDEARPKPQPEVAQAGGVVDTENIHSSNRLPNRAFGEDLDKDRKSGSYRNFGRKPKYKDKHGETIN